jgi:hypothetical protein
MKKLKWILIVYLSGWLAIWLAQKAAGRERFPIPGITERTAAIRVQQVSPGEALVSRTAKVGYNLILSAEFPWFLPKSAAIRCRYDNIADNRGLSVVKENEGDFRVACRGPGEASFACEEARWILSCSPAGVLRIDER